MNFFVRLLEFPSQLIDEQFVFLLYPHTSDKPWEKFQWFLILHVKVIICK